MKVKLLFCLLLAICWCTSAIAQVSLYDFKTPSGSITLTAGSSQILQPTFEITIQKPIGTALDSRSLFQVYAVTSRTLTPSSSNSLPTFNVQLPTTWTPVGGNTERGVVTGSFHINYNSTSNGRANEIEMLYTGYVGSTSYSNISDNTIHINTTVTTPTVNTICGLSGATGQGNQICRSQFVPYTSRPALLTGQEKGQDDYVFEWEYSYSGTQIIPGQQTGWQNTGGTEQNFQPWDCWQTVHYRRKTLSVHKNWLGQTYHDYVADSNPVLIIPYVLVNSGNYLIRNRRSGQVLEIGGNSTSDGTQATQSPSRGTVNQQWQINSLGDGSYTLVNANSQKGLVVNTEGRGAPIMQYSGSALQQWLFQPVYGSPGFYTITNAFGGLVMEIGGGSPQNSAQNAGADHWYYYGAGTDHGEQEWELIPVPAPVAGGNRFPGVYTITNVNSNQVLEAGGNYPDPITAGTKINQWPYGGTSNQHWTITETDPGYYKIVNRNSGFCLEIGGNLPAPTTAGTLANQWPYFGNLNQQWAINEVSPGSGMYYFINRGSSYALEIGGSSTKDNGAKANQWYYSGGLNQRWYINLFAQNRMMAPQPVTTQASSTEAVAMSVFPNPTAGVATISYSLATAATVSAEVTDALGRKIAAITKDEHQEPGHYELAVPTLARGVYVVRLVHNGVTEHKKLVVE